MKQADALNILKAGRNSYVTGAAGSGKTHVLNDYISYLKYRGVPVGITASTGIAATHIGGVTIHSWSGIGIKNTLSEEDIEALTEKEYLWKRFDKTRVLIIDEVSMLSPQLFDSVERVCRAMKRNSAPFGGMQVVLSGDFFQLPPITRLSARQAGEDGETKFIHTSDAWKSMDVRVCYLEEQFRHDDISLERILNEIRGGNVSSATRAVLQNMCGEKRGHDTVRTRLYTHNVDVDAENERELAKLPGKERVYTMFTKGKASVVASLKKSILAPETLRLKKDASVMFVKNSFDGRYANGTLGTVENFNEVGAPVVRTFSGKEIVVDGAEWAIEENGKVLGKVGQLPLRLAWAITVHKSQGMSMDAAEIDLSKSFVPGQGYVALSRLRRLSGLSLVGLNNMAFAVHPHVTKLDAHLLSQSAKWEKVLARFDGNEMNDMHVEFIQKCGGTTDEKEIEKNKKKIVAEPEARMATHEKTKHLIEKRFSLADIAKERGQTLGTIISHLEKLREKNSGFDLTAYKPKEKDLKIIRAAFKKTDSTKLAPAHGYLNGRYSYEELRIARLFL